ncbi:hypothetical protein SO802_014070 [Lithocarpus litseifolius]|uniref:Uncharacterized protein n=1 Tax=Lithocarpus litseifolius TaxID=425828 RepID=A0AAW2D898_9ROSI
MPGGASMDYEDPPRMSPPIFNGSTHDGVCIFVPTPGMPTPPLVHVNPTMATSSPTPTKRLYRLSRYRLRTLSRWRVCRDRDALVCMLPIAGPVMVTGISMQKVLIGENLGGCASICGSFLGENTGFQCVYCQQIEILEKTQMVYCIY